MAGMIMLALLVNGAQREVTAHPDTPLYPVPRMDEIPAIHIELLQGTREPSSGAGQIGVAPIAPAIASAVCRLTGARLRALPMLPDKGSQKLLATDEHR